MAVHQKRPAVFVVEAGNNAVAENLDTESSESELEFDVDDKIRQSEPSENAIYNRDGLLDKLGDISWPENVDRIHKLSFDVNQDQEVDANDDLTRELVFYTQALEGTKEAFLKFQSVGRPFLMPTDYNGAMVKNDTHSVKVKDQESVYSRSSGGAKSRTEGNSIVLTGVCNFVLKLKLCLENCASILE